MLAEEDIIISAERLLRHDRDESNPARPSIQDPFGQAYCKQLLYIYIYIKHVLYNIMGSSERSFNRGVTCRLSHSSASFRRHVQKIGTHIYVCIMYIYLVIRVVKYCVSPKRTQYIILSRISYALYCIVLSRGDDFFFL